MTRKSFAGLPTSAYGRPFLVTAGFFVFTRKNSRCFQRVLTIIIMSVRLFVCLSHG